MRFFLVAIGAASNFCYSLEQARADKAGKNAAKRLLFIVSE